MMRGKAKPKRERRTSTDYLDAAWNELQTARMSLETARLQYHSTIEANTIAGIVRDLLKLEQRVARIEFDHNAEQREGGW